MKCHLIWGCALILACATTAWVTLTLVKATPMNAAGPVAVFHAGNPDDGSAELRVCASDSGTRLMGVERGASEEVSPDSRWIAVADANGSNSTEFRLFQRGHGLEFKEVEVPAPWIALKLLRRIDCSICDHQYVVPQQWINDHTIEVTFSAHGYPEHSVNNATLLYDVVRREWHLPSKSAEN